MQLCTYAVMRPIKIPVAQKRAPPDDMEHLVPEALRLKGLQPGDKAQHVAAFGEELLE